MGPDINIKNITIIENDFGSFFNNYPNIRYVYFNGVKAEKEYFKKVLPKLSRPERYLNYDRLPSTSPAMTQLSLKAKILEWSKIKKKHNIAASQRPLVPHGL